MPDAASGCAVEVSEPGRGNPPPHHQIGGNMKADRDELIFSTGKTVRINRGIVGICLADHQKDRAKLFYGYDGDIDMPEDVYAEPAQRLTHAECVELADEMLKRWAEFREGHLNR